MMTREDVMAELANFRRSAAIMRDIADKGEIAEPTELNRHLADTIRSGSRLIDGLITFIEKVI